jgi:membrane-associated phospholipid phosphatase
MPEAPHATDLSSVLTPKTLRLSGWLALFSIAIGLGLHHSEANVQLLLWLHRHPSLPDAAWLFITQWGDSAQALVLLLALFLHRPLPLSWVLKTWLMGVIASPLLKSAWDTARPLAVVDPSWLHPIGQPPMGQHAMPSGHALAAGSMAAILFFSLSLHRDGRPYGWRFALVFCCFLVAVSRVVVGAHWPGDVAVGWGLGWMLVLLAMRWEQAQAWAKPLASNAAGWWVLALQAVLLWAVWHLPTEGWGMSLSRAVVTGVALVAFARALQRRRVLFGAGSSHD